MRAIEAGDIEEERRLCYVGLTRAKRELYLTCARTRNLYGSRDFGIPSRFLGEIPLELSDREQQAARTPAAGVARWDSGAGTVRASPRQPTPGASFALGDEVVHAAFGEGMVIGHEPGGLIVVRFSGDGSERKLMADYAPLKRR